MRCRAGLVVAALLASSACSDGGDSSVAEPTVPTAAPSSSTSSAVADIATIPEVIDEPYLNRVLAALDEVDGKATRVIVQHKDLVPEAAEILNSIYSDEEFTRQADVWLAALDQDPDLTSGSPEVIGRTSAVDRIIGSSAKCVWLAVNRAYPQTGPHPARNQTEYVALQPLDRSNDPKRHNPTAWMIIADGFREDGAEPSIHAPKADAHRIHSAVRPLDRRRVGTGTTISEGSSACQGSRPDHSQESSVEYRRGLRTRW